MVSRPCGAGSYSPQGLVLYCWCKVFIIQLRAIIKIEDTIIRIVVMSGPFPFAIFPANAGLSASVQERD
jgi:hypothetical protein